MQFPWRKPIELSSRDLIDEFIETYQLRFPDEKPGEIGADSIQWEKPDGSTHTIMLGKVFYQVARLEKKNTLPNRREIYRGFIGALFSGEAMPDSFDTPEFRARILPAIRQRPYLDHVRRQAKSEVPHRDLSADLIVTYVIDFPDKTAHIMDKQAEELKLDEAALYQLAMENLRAIYPRQNFRDLFNPAEKVVGVVCADGHAAARVLLIREYLEEGEEIAVVVSDGAMLALIEVPPDGNWNPLRQFAAGANATGFERPFWVRPGKIELM